MHEGRFSLIRLFTSLAMVGAEWVMWILIGLSVFSIAIMLERGRFYWSLSDNLEKLAADIRDLLRRDDVAGARARLEKSPSPAATIALAGLNEADRGPDAANEAMLGATARARLGLERNLAFLATVGNNAPFIGLLGTVIGIIQAFDALKAEQTTAAQAARQQAATAAAAVANAGALGATGRVMGTIAEALVATAIGLFVAIPAVAAFNYFQRKVRSIVASGETLSHVVLAHLRALPASATKSEAVAARAGSEE
jgi:biopolymer transport protein ExbB